MNRKTRLNVSKVLNIKKFCAIMIPENLSMKNKFFRSFSKIGQNRLVGLPVHPRNKMADFPMEASRVFNTKEMSKSCEADFQISKEPFNLASKTDNKPRTLLSTV